MPFKNKEEQRRWYMKNKDITKARAYGRREMRQELINEWKETLHCTSCGEPILCAELCELHHRDPNKKKMGISSAIKFMSDKDLVLEIEKCDPYCLNCHRLLHIFIRHWIDGVGSYPARPWMSKNDVNIICGLGI